MPTTYKVLGQSAPTTTSEATLYTVPAATQTVVSSITVSNLTSTVADATINICVNGAASSDANSIVKTIQIGPKSTVAFTLGITLGAADVIRITSGTGSALSFQAFGSEIS